MMILLKENKCFYIIIILFFGCLNSIAAQQIISIDDRLAWKEKLGSNVNERMLSLSPTYKVNTRHSDIPYISLFTEGPFSPVVRLSYSDTLILVGIPHNDYKATNSYAYFQSIRYVFDWQQNTYNFIDSRVIDSEKVFGNEVTNLDLMQYPRKTFFKDLEVNIFETDMEELHVKISGSEYGNGNALLIYTAQSATPKIIVQ